jgi:hypothetical protein
VEEQSSGELASADLTTRAQDAGLQEPRISPTITFNPCRRLQYLQHPTTSDFSIDAPRLPRSGDGHLARGGRLKTRGTWPFAFLIQQRDKALASCKARRPGYGGWRRGTDRPAEVHDRKVMSGRKAPRDYRPEMACSPEMPPKVPVSGVTLGPGSAELRGVLG